MTITPRFQHASTSAVVGLPGPAVSNNDCDTAMRGCRRECIPELVVLSGNVG
jgi:hypothetical protein